MMLGVFFDINTNLIGMGLAPPLVFILWGSLSGVLSMFIYKKTSPQEKIIKLKSEIHGAQKELAAFDGDFLEVLPKIKNTLWLSLRQVGLSFAPTLVALIPMVLLFVGCEELNSAMKPEGADLLAFGPPWIRSWVFVFLSSLFTSSVLIKFIFKIG